MLCSKCDSPRLCSVEAKCSDMCGLKMETEKGQEHHGYVPDDMGLGGNEDYVRFTYCLNCGQIQGDWPLSETKLEQDALDDGTETCGDCDGTGTCSACDGTGDDDGETCDSCAGSGECDMCEGSGKVPALE